MIPPFLHTDVPTLAEVWDSPAQTAHYITSVFKLVAYLLPDTWLVAVTETEIVFIQYGTIKHTLSRDTHLGSGVGRSPPTSVSRHFTFL
jgi:hypothetical protein